jgi:single-strand DNA-binding protein
MIRLPITHRKDCRLPISTSSSTRPLKKVANWIKVSCFGKLAEVASIYLHTGVRIAVIGILDQNNKWQGDDGQTLSTFQIICNTIEFIKTYGWGFESGEAPSDEDVPF